MVSQIQTYAFVISRKDGPSHEPKSAIIAAFWVRSRLDADHGDACSTILVGRAATSNGAVLMSHSCDGDVMGLVYVMPAQSYPPALACRFTGMCRAENLRGVSSQPSQGYDQVGTLPVSETYRSLILAGNLESMTTGGLNEHGLNIAIEFSPCARVGL